jgi:hypothetical protein
VFSRIKKKTKILQKNRKEKEIKVEIEKVSMKITAMIE